MIDSIIKCLFSFVWRKRLADGDNKLIKVKGWRTALIQTPSKRMTVTFLFNWEKA